jgi:hypothetical protein
LREEVVGHAYRHLPRGGELLDHPVIVGKVLRTSARVDGAGDTQAIEFAHEVPGGIQLVFEAAASGPLARVCVKQSPALGLRQQQPGRIAGAIALDLGRRVDPACRLV